MKIAISSGHGKYIRGARGNPVPPQVDEVDEARRIVDEVAKLWGEMGHEVFVFHDDTSHDQSTNLHTITDAHNRSFGGKGHDLDVSVHLNCYDHSAHGVEVLYVTQQALAAKVSAAIAAIGFTNRGAKYRSDLYVLNNTNEPAILLETFFCDHTGDCNTYNSRFEDVCEAIAESITGEEIAEAPEQPPEQPPAEQLPLVTGPLRYLIGSDDDSPIETGANYEFSYDANRGDTAYGNLRDERGRFRSLEDANANGKYAPYLPPDDITAAYGEYCPDPSGPGYLKNIREQIARAKKRGAVRIEWDNPDTRGLQMSSVLEAHTEAQDAGLRTVAKNPLLTSDPALYLSHPSVDMAICERDPSQGSDAMDKLRRAIGQPTLAVRFVAYVDGDENGAAWAEDVAETIRRNNHQNMGVTISHDGEYTSVQDVVLPVMNDEQPPTMPPTLPEPPSVPVRQPVIGRGDTGPAVVSCQQSLGLPVDGDFGPTTESGVMAFQKAMGLGADGVVGEKTWAKLDDLDLKMRAGDDGISDTLAAAIDEIVDESPLQGFDWDDRGEAPPGYYNGMAKTYAVAVLKYKAGDAAAKIMAQANTGNDDTDALAWYSQEFEDAGFDNSENGIDTLRHLFVMLFGLGMRESSGDHWCGRDMSATNVESDTCEAGLFQSSWNLASCSSTIDDLFEEYFGDPNGFRPTFDEGLYPVADDLDVYGSGDGATYQWLAKFSPAFAALMTGVGLRKRKDHWGPIKRREVELVEMVDDLLIDVERAISLDQKQPEA